jgi:hypothetical protein
MYKLPIELFEMDGNGCHLFVDATIGGEVGCLVIDTGASQTVLSRYSEGVQNALQKLDYNEFLTQTQSESLSETLSEEELKELGVAENGVVSMAANGDAIDFEFGIIQDFKIGELEVEKFAVGTIDLTNINRLYEKLNKSNVLGLLGSDFLLKYKAVIDYETKLLTLKL